MQNESVFHDRLALGLPSKDEDVLTAKQLFKEIGRLDEPAGGFSRRFDRDLDDAVTGLQRDKGLKVDGLIRRAVPPSAISAAIAGSCRRSLRSIRSSSTSPPP